MSQLICWHTAIGDISERGRTPRAIPIALEGLGGSWRVGALLPDGRGDPLGTLPQHWGCTSLLGPLVALNPFYPPLKFHSDLCGFKHLASASTHKHRYLAPQCPTGTPRPQHARPGHQSSPRTKGPQPRLHETTPGA